MPLLLTLLSKAWPALLAGAVLGILTGWATHKVDSVSYARLETTYASYRAQVAGNAEAAEKASRGAITAQLAQREAVDRNNAQVMDDLRKRTTEAESHRNADRDLIRGLLNSASKAPAATDGSAVSKGDHRSVPDGASGESGIEQVADLCADIKGEDERNADRLDALRAQIKPQQETP